MNQVNCIVAAFHFNQLIFYQSLQVVFVVSKYSLFKSQASYPFLQHLSSIFNFMEQINPWIDFVLMYCLSFCSMQQNMQLKLNIFDLKYPQISQVILNSVITLLQSFSQIIYIDLCLEIFILKVGTNSQMLKYHATNSMFILFNNERNLVALTLKNHCKCRENIIRKYYFTFSGGFSLQFTKKRTNQEWQIRNGKYL